MKKTLVSIYYLGRDVMVRLLNGISKRRPLGYHRIYQVHIRKTAGTSINAAFWDFAGYGLKNVGSRNVLYGNQLVMVRNNKRLIEKGNYFYANSHTPFWSLNLPSSTYTFCIFRDPFERLFSLYKYYKWILELEPDNAVQQEPYYFSLIGFAQCAAEGFDSFLDSISKSDMLNQLFHFSENYNLEEALTNCEKLSAIFFQENFNNMLEELRVISQLELRKRNDRKSSPKASIDITEAEKQRAMELLEEEYSFYNAVKDKYDS
jgi:hypothetical protein